MSRRKTERLLSLVVCLLSAGRFLTAGQIRAAVPGYPDTFDAFKRMFERDKDELRELGIPLETGTNPGAGDEVGYRISRQAYELPEIRLEPDEAAVLGLAARVWRQAELAGAAAGGLLKLRAAGIDAEETTQPGIEPRLQAAEAAFGALWQAVRDRRPVTFGYRAAGRSSSQARRLEPWGVVNRHGRIDGPVSFAGPPGTVTVPPGTDVRETVKAWDADPPGLRTALVRLRQGAAHGLRQRASGCRPDPQDASWDLAELPFSEVSWFADHIASFGTDVIALEPADLREAVIRRLKGVLA